MGGVQCSGYGCSLHHPNRACPFGDETVPIVEVTGQRRSPVRKRREDHSTLIHNLLFDPGGSRRVIHVDSGSDDRESAQTGPECRTVCGLIDSPCES